MAKWGPSPIVNHHGQLAKLRQEGRYKFISKNVADYKLWLGVGQRKHW